MSDPVVRDNADAHRFELAIDGGLVFLDYEIQGDAILLLHAETPARLRGRGLASLVTAAALDAARQRGLRVVPVCPFVAAYQRQHPEPQTTGQT
jgi:predicted GNAT family acetyltransferase